MAAKKTAPAPRADVPLGYARDELDLLFKLLRLKVEAQSIADPELQRRVQVAVARATPQAYAAVAELLERRQED